MAPSPSKALFIGILLLSYALLLTFGGTAPGYTLFHPRTVSNPRYDTIFDRVSISDTEFQQRMSLHARSGEFAMNPGQEAELIRRYKRRTHDLSNNDYLKLLRADSSMSEKQILCALTEYTY